MCRRNLCMDGVSVCTPLTILSNSSLTLIISSLASELNPDFISLHLITAYNGQYSLPSPPLATNDNNLLQLLLPLPQCYSTYFYAHAARKTTTDLIYRTTPVHIHTRTSVPSRRPVIRKSKSIVPQSDLFHLHSRLI